MPMETTMETTMGMPRSHKMKDTPPSQMTRSTLENLSAFVGASEKLSLIYHDDNRCSNSKVVKIPGMILKKIPNRWMRLNEQACVHVLVCLLVHPSHVAVDRKNARTSGMFPVIRRMCFY